MNFRQKNFLISFVFPFLFILFLRVVRFEGFLLYGSIFVGALIMYFLLYWLLNYSVTPIGFITVLLLPVIFWGACVLLYYFFIVKLNPFFELVLVSTFMVLMYYFASTQNLLNISYYKNISLAQAAHTTNNFYTVLTFFLSILALFLIPNVPNLLKLFISVILFTLILFIFVLLHSLDRSEFMYSIFLYFSVVVLLAVIYVLGFIDTNKVILLSVVLGLVFRGVLTFIHYSARKVLSFFDYFQILMELAVITFLIYFVSI